MSDCCISRVTNCVERSRDDDFEMKDMRDSADLNDSDCLDFEFLDFDRDDDVRHE